jgi:hypothetical protein
MTRIIQKALRGNDTPLPIFGQETSTLTHLDLRESHFQKTFGLSPERASLFSNLIEMGCNPHGR